MEKFVNYVKNGKGLGLLFILGAAVIVTFLLGVTVKTFYSEARPNILMTADEFLPITVKGGKIVEPANTYKRLDLNFGDANSSENIIPIVLDTKTQNPLPSTAKQGIYITTDTVYVVSANKINRIALQDGVIDREAFEDLLDLYAGYFSALMGVIIIFGLFIAYLIKAWIAAFLGKLILKFASMKEVYSFDALMRLCAVLTAASALISWGLELTGIYTFTGFQMLVCVLIAEVLILFRGKPQNQA